LAGSTAPALSVDVDADCWLALLQATKEKAINKIGKIVFFILNRL
jgi:hypothetical protein